VINARCRRLLFPITCLLQLAPALLAQSLTTGGIAGTIKDPSGALMLKVIVVLKNMGTGTTEDTETNSQGLYRFSFLPPGDYLVTADAPNFMTTGKTIPVLVGQSAPPISNSRSRARPPASRSPNPLSAFKPIPRTSSPT